MLRLGGRSRPLVRADALRPQDGLQQQRRRGSAYAWSASASKKKPGLDAHAGELLKRICRDGEAPEEVVAPSLRKMSSAGTTRQCRWPCSRGDAHLLRAAGVRGARRRLIGCWRTRARPWLTAAWASRAGHAGGGPAGQRRHCARATWRRVRAWGPTAWRWLCGPRAGGPTTQCPDDPEEFLEKAAALHR